MRICLQDCQLVFHFLLPTSQKSTTMLWTCGEEWLMCISISTSASRRPQTTHSLFIHATVLRYKPPHPNPSRADSFCLLVCVHVSLACKLQFDALAKTLLVRFRLITAWQGTHLLWKCQDWSMGWGRVLFLQGIPADLLRLTLQAHSLEAINWMESDGNSIRVFVCVWVCVYKQDSSIFGVAQSSYPLLLLYCSPTSRTALFPWADTVASQNIPTPKGAH